MTLEAAIVFPFYAAFILALLSLIRISVADAALHNAVNETTKQIAVHMYPVDLLLNEVSATKTGQNISQYIDTIKSGREKAAKAEKFAEHYAFLIPDPLLELVRWEKEMRDQTEEAAKEQIQRALCRAFQPLVVRYLDTGRYSKTVLNPANVQIVKVILPNLKNTDEAYFGIEAVYQLVLPIPFIHKTIRIKKSGYERVWIGDN